MLTGDKKDLSTLIVSIHSNELLRRYASASVYLVSKQQYVFTSFAVLLFIMQTRKRGCVLERFSK